MVSHTFLNRDVSDSDRVIVEDDDVGGGSWCAPRRSSDDSPLPLIASSPIPGQGRIPRDASAP